MTVFDSGHDVDEMPPISQLGRKGQLLVAALDAAKEARRGRVTGQKSSGGYGKLFRVNSHSRDGSNDIS